MEQSTVKGPLREFHTYLGTKRSIASAVERFFCALS